MGAILKKKLFFQIFSVLKPAQLNFWRMHLFQTLFCGHGVQNLKIIHLELYNNNVKYSAKTLLEKLPGIMEVNNNVESISYESIEMEKIKKDEIKIGPEVRLDLEHIDKIQTHSSFICFECIKIVSSK